MGSLIKTIKDIKRSEQLIISPRFSDWLAKNPNLSLQEPHADLLKRLTMSDANARRDGRFGASSRGDCMRQQIFKFLGMPGLLHYDFALSNVFLDGTWRHLRWQMMLMEAGVVTDVEVPYKMPDKRLSVSLDAENHDEGWMFELKGTRNMPHEVPHKHLLQMHTCMYVSGFEVAVYIAENKATQDFREWVVKKDPKIMSEVTREIYKLNEAIDERKLPGPVSDPRRKEGPCKACPYQPWCWEQRSWPYDQQWDKEREPTKVAIKRGRRKLPRA